MSLRDECSDSARMGETPRSRDSFMMDSPVAPYGTLWEEKLENPGGINATRGAADMILPGERSSRDNRVSPDDAL